MTEKEEYGKKVDSNFYAGADYGLDPNWGKEYSLGLGAEAMYPTSGFGLTTDPRTSAQLAEVSKKLSTGAKTIEVEGISLGGQPMDIIDSIPKQHFKEMNRLKKLVGVDLTFHGPLVEPTGVTRQGWDDTHRQQSERQMWSAVEKAHELDPDGNVVVTFHSSTALPESETRVINEKTGVEEIKDFMVVDEAHGQFKVIHSDADYFKSLEGMKMDAKLQEELMKKKIAEQNKEEWYRQLQGVSYHANIGEDTVRKALAKRETGEEGTDFDEDNKTALNLYKEYKEGKVLPQLIEELGGPEKVYLKRQIQNITHGDLYLRDAYQALQNLFNQVYPAAEGGDKKKLDAFRSEIKDKLEYIEKPEKLPEFAELIVKGVNVLNSITPPQTFKPLRDFAIDKSSETFSNLAFNAYEKFKNNAPIISVENPPAGGGLSRARDLKEVVEASREKLEKKFVDELGMSSDEAKTQAEKLIGVTWDVGHINMIRKFGYDKEAVVAETKEVAPLVKHVHLSDNFGMEHTELPMGMDVPLKPMLAAIQKFNAQAKKIVETGGAWFRDFKISPFRETLRAFGSPLYSMKMAPYWDQYANTSGGFFAGYGQMLPEHHFSIYGAGFSSLPTELGGQMSGRSRVSGTPIE